VGILGRYILKEHRAPFLFALGALTGLLVLNQLARQFNNLIGKGLPWGVIGSVFGLSFPFILAMTLPMAVLVATLHAFSRLAADSEITALRASGVNLRRAMVPVLLAAATVMLAEFVWVDQVLPRANHRLKNLLIDIARKKPTFELREQMVNEVEPGRLFLRAGRIDQAADRMRDVVIYDLGSMNRRRTIYADSGYIRFNPARTDLFLTLFDGYIHDYDRARAGTFRRIFFTTDFVRVRGVSNNLERTATNSMRSDREQSLCEMEAVVRGDLRNARAVAAERERALRNDALALVGVAAPPPGPADTATSPPGRLTLTAAYCRLLELVGATAVPATLSAQEPQAPSRRFEAPRREMKRAAAPVRRDSAARLTGGAPPRTTSWAEAVGTAPQAPANVRLRATADRSGDQLRGQLGSIAVRRDAALQHASSYQVEIHKKYSLAFSCLVFVLIGGPIALRFPRGGMGLVLAASVVIFGIYYIGLLGGEPLADRGVIPPFWAMWTPNLVMAAVGLVLFARLGTEQVTTRGGWWSELAARLRERRRARAARRLGRVPA
jgi:lipopolysaccharide export system permease protein